MGHGIIGKIIEFNTFGKINRGVLLDEDDGAWYLYTGARHGYPIIVILDKNDATKVKVIGPSDMDVTPFHGMVNNLRKLYIEDVTAG